MTERTPLLYNELASWWRLMSAPEEYAEESGYYTDLLRRACQPKYVLELGSGGGHNASHMKRNFELTLVELSPGMLEQSRDLNPECEHLLGDMRNVRLGRTFDAVFVHDAIMYMTTRDDLASAIQTAAVHVESGGAVLIAPDCFRETFVPKSETGGHDGAGRGMRWIEWDFDPDPDDTTFTTDYAYLLRDGDAPVRVVHDRHTLGLFPRATWLDLCRAAGLEPEVHAVPLQEPGAPEYNVIVCRKAA